MIMHLHPSTNVLHSGGGTRLFQRLFFYLKLSHISLSLSPLALTFYSTMLVLFYTLSFTITDFRICLKIIMQSSKIFPSAWLSPFLRKYAFLWQSSLTARTVNGKLSYLFKIDKGFFVHSKLFFRVLPIYRMLGTFLFLFRLFKAFLTVYVLPYFHNFCNNMTGFKIGYDD